MLDRMPDRLAHLSDLPVASFPERDAKRRVTGAGRQPLHVRRRGPLAVDRDAARQPPCTKSMHHGCARRPKEFKMEKNRLFEDFQSRIQQALDRTPARDLEKNFKAMVTQGLSRLDMVTREEFDIQAQVLAKTRARLEMLEARVTELESQLKKPV